MGTQHDEHHPGQQPNTNASQDTPAGPVLSTFTGSLPHGPKESRLRELLTQRELGQPIDGKEFAALAQKAVDRAVAFQVRLGLDIISATGEVDRANFIDSHRLTGFENSHPADSNFAPADISELGATGILALPGTVMPPVNTGKVRHNPEPLAAELDRCLRALNRHGVNPARAFLPEPSPGVIAFQGSEYYDSEAAYLDAVTVALAAECRMVYDAGLIVQIDAPDLLMSKFAWRQHDHSWPAFRARLRRGIELINDVTDGIPPHMKRIHLCHGNWGGPHTWDVELPDVLEDLYGLTAGTLVIELSNPVHRWELSGPFCADWSTFPPDKTLAAGVVDSCSMSAGHAKQVATAILQAVEAIGDPARVQASTDCGYGTMAGLHAHPRVTELQLTRLAEGTHLANARLRNRASASQPAPA